MGNTRTRNPRRPAGQRTPTAPPMSTELVVITRNEVAVPVEATVTDTETGKKVTFTPYQAHKAVNQLLAAAGLSKTIPPQMMYRYRMDGRFKSTMSEDGKWVVDLESFQDWVMPYVEKSVRLAARAA